MEKTKNINLLGEYNGKKFGGKSDNLNILKKNNIEIPKGFCIGNNNFINLKNFYKQYINSDLYIVRSSSSCEDGNKLSYAGLFKSIEGKYKNGKLMKDIEEVFESINNPLLNIYEKKILGKIIKNRKMNVLVQEYIVGDYSGIYFSNLDKKRVLSIIKGGNKLLVNGEINGTNIYMDKKFNIIKHEYNIQEKFFDGDLEKIEYNKKVEISNILFLRLIREFIKIEKLFKFEVDIEWTIKNDIIYILQVRPITT